MKFLLLKLVLCFALGAISSYAMAPYNIWACLFLGLSGFFIIVDRSKSASKTAILGFFFSMGYFGLSLSWVANALLVEGNPYFWAWPLALCGLPFILSLFTAFFLAIYQKIAVKKPPAIKFIIFTIALCIAELARGHLFTGFPWNLYGYTWISIPQIANSVALYNIYGLTFLTIFWALTPAITLHKTVRIESKILILCISIISFISIYYYGTQKLNDYETDKATHKHFANVIVVQPNIKQSEKWHPEKQRDNFMKLLEITLNAAKETNADTKNLIIWPETAIADNVLNSEWARGQITQTLGTFESETYLITGALRQTGKENIKKTEFFNSIIVFDKNMKVKATYDKSHLVPFGEYMPLSEIFDIAPIVGFQGFSKGKSPEPISLTDTITFLPLICYEIIFPHMASMTQIVKNNIIVNVTNDAWYGTSAGPYQHLVKSQFRAMEQKTIVIRSANTGVSAVILPNGQIENSLPLNQAGYILKKLSFDQTKSINPKLKK